VTAIVVGNLPPLFDLSLPVRSACYIVAMAAWLGFAIPMFTYMKR
jgi:hypothetical protein